MLSTFNSRQWFTAYVPSSCFNSYQRVVSGSSVRIPPPSHSPLISWFLSFSFFLKVRTEHSKQWARTPLISDYVQKIQSLYNFLCKAWDVAVQEWPSNLYLRTLREHSLKFKMFVFKKMVNLLHISICLIKIRIFLFILFYLKNLVFILHINSSSFSLPFFHFPLPTPHLLLRGGKASLGESAKSSIPS